ncbi:DUF2659 family protein [Rickettsia endosymbiont of Cardiosporidium cionae]|uniref:DUF2659 family protein n=1 Tax=Rickettsia endosymbiont of Cardiosporidium cionae TaxID=2777155 RepID=UPI0018963A04|nr:hypothetical protein [Rickettsia endosymbiont of Cardiosporidium cionae]KAF8818341.1 hypothetical protein IHI24_000803 [Rickettsia endosymbiont of Cardiosporidium cionae]
MSDLFEETVAEARHNKFVNIFYRMLPFVIVITVGISIFIWFQGKRNEERLVINQKFTDKLLGIMSGVVVDTDIIKNLLVDNENTKHHEITELQLALQFISSKKIDESLILLEKMIDNKNYSNITKSFSRISFVNLIIDKENVSELEKEKSKRYLEYFDNEKKEFFNISLLIKAVFYYKIGDKDLAKKYSSELLAIENISYVIKEQANSLLSLLE